MQVLGLPITLEGRASCFPIPAFLLESPGFGVSGIQAYSLSYPTSIRTPILKSSSHNLLNLRTYVGRNSGNHPDIEDEDENDQDTYEAPVEPESWDGSIEIEIEKTGRNSRRIRSKIGQQNLAFGLKFKAKGVIDCYEKEVQILPNGEKRDIEFKMVEGDFQLFEGKWSVEQEVECNTESEQNGSTNGQDLRTTLYYVVDVEPKLWLPVRLVEGRLCREIKTNLSCIREEAEKVFLKALSAY